MECPRCGSTSTLWLFNSYDDHRCWEHWVCEFCAREFSDTIDCDEAEEYDRVIMDYNGGGFNGDGDMQHYSTKTSE